MDRVYVSLDITIFTALVRLWYTHSLYCWTYIQTKDGKQQKQQHHQQGFFRRRTVGVATVAAVVAGATVLYLLLFRSQATVYIPVNFDDKLKEVRGEGRDI